MTPVDQLGSAAPARSGRGIIGNPFFVAIIYTALMAMVVGVARYAFDVPYGKPGFTTAIALPMLLPAGFALWAARANGLNWLGRWTNWRAWMWVAPWLVLELLMLVLLGSHVAADSSIWLATLVALFACVLVGIGEEVTYRGVVLQLGLQRWSVPIAMLVSAVAFSLLHAVNPIGGVTALEAAKQLWLTFLYGLALAPVALLGKTLIPLVTVHALWDFLVLFASGIPDLAGVLGLLTVLDLLLLVVVAAVAWTVALRRWRAGTL